MVASPPLPAHCFTGSSYCLPRLALNALDTLQQNRKSCLLLGRREFIPSSHDQHNDVCDCQGSHAVVLTVGLACCCASFGASCDGTTLWCKLVCVDQQGNS